MNDPSDTEDVAIALTVTDANAVPMASLGMLYRITGRSKGELARAIRAGDTLYAAHLFGSDHLQVVPRLEKVIAHLDAVGAPFTLYEQVGAQRSAISRETLRGILEGA